MESLARKLTSEGAASSFAARSSAEDLEGMTRLIRLDVHRTEVPSVSGRDRSVLEERLERLLAAYAFHDPEVGYCQGELAIPSVQAVFVLQSGAISLSVGPWGFSSNLPPVESLCSWFPN